MARTKERYQVLCDAASSHAVWRQQWGGYSASTVSTLLTFSDARLARLRQLLELGQQGRHALYQAVNMTDDKWEQGAAQRAAEAAAPAQVPVQVGGAGGRHACCRPHIVQSCACYNC
jgi:hypothetical protein